MDNTPQMPPILPLGPFQLGRTQTGFFMTLGILRPSFVGAAINPQGQAEWIVTFDMSPMKLKELVGYLNVEIETWERIHGEIPQTIGQQATVTPLTVVQANSAASSESSNSPTDDASSASPPTTQSSPDSTTPSSAIPPGLMPFVPWLRP